MCHEIQATLKKAYIDYTIKYYTFQSSKAPNAVKNGPSKLFFSLSFIRHNTCWKKKTHPRTNLTAPLRKAFTCTLRGNDNLQFSLPKSALFAAATNSYQRKTPREPQKPKDEPRLPAAASSSGVAHSRQEPVDGTAAGKPTAAERSSAAQVPPEPRPSGPIPPRPFGARGDRAGRTRPSPHTNPHSPTATSPSAAAVRTPPTSGGALAAR